MTDPFRVHHDEARAVFPLLPQWYEMNAGGVTLSFEGLDAGGLPIFQKPDGFDIESNQQQHAIVYHEDGHAFAALAAKMRGTTVEVLLRLFGGRFGYAAGADLWESWAEVFANAVAGRVVTSKSSKDEQVDPLAARSFFLSLIAPEGNTVAQGCDISVYQGNVDFDALKGAVSFVIAKATEGSGYKDGFFDRNWSEAERVGLRRGAYHFARPDLGNEAQDEARWFLANLGPLGSGDIVALDYEVSWDGDVVGWCKAWLDFVRQSTGTAPYVYLNLSLIRRHDWTPVIDAGYPLWLASYSIPPDPVSIPDDIQWPSVAMKQWTSSGQVAGTVGNVDLDTYFGEEDHMDDTQVLDAVNRATVTRLAAANAPDPAFTLPDTVIALKQALGHVAAAIDALQQNDAAEARRLTAAAAELIK